MKEHVRHTVINCIGIIMLAACFLACPQVVHATEYVPQSGGAVIYDEKPIDNFSGEIISSNEQALTGETRISSNCVYDRMLKQYVYTVGDNSEKKVTSNVADGMIINDVVSIDTGNSNDFTLYKDGKKLEKADMNSILEKGVYVLLFDGRKVLEFTIAGKYSSFQTFSLPDGFSVVKVVRDDVEVTSGTSQVDFSLEGKYTVQYKCNYTGAMYSFTTIIDHTPPVLALSALDEQNRAQGPVYITDVEDGGDVVVLFNGEEIETTGKLTQNGPYTVTVYDAAGNSTTYDFVIMLYFNLSGIGFLLAVIGVAVGLGVYVIVSAKKMRVC